MNPQTLHAMATAQEAVAQLVEACRRPGPLYRENPRQVAQVSRTAKWLLNALATLRRTLDSGDADPANDQADSA